MDIKIPQLPTSSEAAETPLRTNFIGFQDEGDLMIFMAGGPGINNVIYDSSDTVGPERVSKLNDRIKLKIKPVVFLVDRIFLANKHFNSHGRISFSANSFVQFLSKIESNSDCLQAITFYKKQINYFDEQADLLAPAVLKNLTDKAQFEVTAKCL